MVKQGECESVIDWGMSRKGSEVGGVGSIEIILPHSLEGYQVSSMLRL